MCNMFSAMKRHHNECGDKVGKQPFPRYSKDVFTWYGVRCFRTPHPGLSRVRGEPEGGRPLLTQFQTLSWRRPDTARIVYNCVLSRTVSAKCSNHRHRLFFSSPLIIGLFLIPVGRNMVLLSRTKPRFLQLS